MNTISVKIDVTKIDKERLFKGKKGTYMDLILIPTPNNQYGNDYMCVQGVSKEEREAGIKGEILGNGKMAVGSAPAPTADAGRPQTGPAEDIDEDVPF